MSNADSFFAKLDDVVHRHNSLLCVGLDPHPANLPDKFRSEADPVQGLLAWNQAIIAATAEYAAVYKPNIAFYEALGDPGQHLLRATLDAIPDDIPVLLDAKRGDIGSTAAAYAQACFKHWGVDAVTLSPYLGRDSIEPFASYPDKGLFVLCHTSNPGAQDFQEFEVNDWRMLDREPNQPLYIHVARTATHWWPNIALVVGATYPAAIEATRAAAPDAWFLIPGIGAQGGDLEATVSAGLRADNSGIIVNASRSIANADDPGGAARYMRDAINTVRNKPHAGVDVPSGLTAHERALVDGLLALEAIKFGSFTLASGIQSPFYIDLRLLVSAPELLQRAATEYARIVSRLQCDRIAGVPYAALPIGTAVSLQTGIPMIFLRKEAKAYGMGKDIEGLWQPGERVVIIEDLITSGGSTLKTVQRLREVGLIVEDVVVLIDREQGGVENLVQAGIRAHSVFRLTEIIADLERRDRLAPDLIAEIRSFLSGAATP